MQDKETWERCVTPRYDLTASLKERVAHKLNLQDTSSLSFMYLYDEEQYRLEDGKLHIANDSR